MKVSRISENKNEKFRRLAENRTNAIIQKLQLLGNLSNKTIYDYSDEEVKKMFAAIDASLNEVKEKYKAVQKSESKKFKF